MDAYQIVKNARQNSRPTTLKIIEHICDFFEEQYGDRVSGDDPAMVGGVGLLAGKAVTFIGTQKGQNTQENIERHFGSSGPSGYRKAQRLMLQAEKFGRPVVTLINTAGAACSPQAEEAGIGQTIAQSLQVMAQLTVPTIAIFVGEGGSGGAIALAIADKVWMFENSVYSILSPEGFASILFKDASKAKNAADLMKLSPNDLMTYKVIDRIVPEKQKWEDILDTFKELLVEELRQLSKIPASVRFENKKQRFLSY